MNPRRPDGQKRVGIRVERLRPELASRGVVSEARLDEAAVHKRTGVSCPQPKRADRMLLGLGAAPVLVERPCENVLPLDAGPKVSADARPVESRRHVVIMVEIEEGSLQLVPSAV